MNQSDHPDERAACLHTEQLWNISGTHGHCKACGKQFGADAGGPDFEVAARTQPLPPADEPATARLRWLHSEGSNNVDGYEWGIYRVKWVGGRAAEVWQTNADFSDLDEAIQASGQALQRAPETAEPPALSDEPTLAEPMNVLTPPPHPESQIMKWSELELAAIRAYGERCWCAGRSCQ